MAGPNTTTFMFPAEIFPTRYRCTLHGLAAGFGKLGSVLGQVFVSSASFAHLSVGYGSVRSITMTTSTNVTTSAFQEGEATATGDAILTYVSCTNS
jgi:hypothetical protein